MASGIRLSPELTLPKINIQRVYVHCRAGLKPLWEPELGTLRAVACHGVKVSKNWYKMKMKSLEPKNSHVMIEKML